MSNFKGIVVLLDELSVLRLGLYVFQFLAQRVALRNEVIRLRILRQLLHDFCHVSDRRTLGRVWYLLQNRVCLLGKGSLFQRIVIAQYQLVKLNCVQNCVR